LLQTPSVRVTLFAFSEGQELTPHTNQRRALVQVVEGQCEFLFAGKWQKLERGALVHLPPNDSHAVRATSPFKMLLTLCDDGGRQAVRLISARRSARRRCASGRRKARDSSGVKDKVDVWPGAVKLDVSPPPGPVTA